MSGPHDRRHQEQTRGSVISRSFGADVDLPRYRRPPAAVENPDKSTFQDTNESVESSASACMGSLASWMDSLSNLVELNLSNNPHLFAREGNCVPMASLCGTVNQSLRRLSLRHCGLSTNDLELLVSTCCWIEALDLSENSALMEDLQPLLGLEHLSELVLENMSENGLHLSTESSANTSGGSAFTNLLRAVRHAEAESDANMDAENGGGRQPLVRINLSGNKISQETMRELSLLSSLKILILVGCQVESRGLAA